MTRLPTPYEVLTAEHCERAREIAAEMYSRWDIDGRGRVSLADDVGVRLLYVSGEFALDLIDALGDGLGLSRQCEQWVATYADEDEMGEGRFDSIGEGDTPLDAALAAWAHETGWTAPEGGDA